MLAYTDNKIRHIDVPDHEFTGDIKVDLEKVFYYGQNDFQPQPFPSLSVGDVVEYNEMYFYCDGVGWKKISKNNFDIYANTPLEKRREVIKDILCRKVVDETCTIYFNGNDKIHCDDGPAIVYNYGRKEWYKNGNSVS